jgi:hypothetical protein
MAKHPAVGIGISQQTMGPLKQMKRAHAIARGPGFIWERYTATSEAASRMLSRSLGAYYNEKQAVLRRECSPLANPFDSGPDSHYHSK